MPPEVAVRNKVVLQGWRQGTVCARVRPDSQPHIGRHVIHVPPATTANQGVLAMTCIYTSTLHCRGKNGRSKKIGQTNQKMIHFVPNMYVSGKILALRPGTQTVMIFGTTKKIRKLPKTTRFQDLRVFAAGFCGLFAGFLRGFAGFIPSRLMRCKHFLAFVSPNTKTCNQSPKIQDLGVLGKISRYR